MGRLTVGMVKALKEPGRYGDGGTLYLVVAPGGSKSWVQRFTVNGTRQLHSHVTAVVTPQGHDLRRACLVHCASRAI